MNLIFLFSLAFTATIVATQQNEGRIVGGLDTKIDFYPWAVSIRENNQHQCGGSILSNSWILTAAHCQGQSVQYGVTDISETGTTIVQIYKWYRHNSYSGGMENQGYADIAAVKLAKSIVYSQNAQAARLPARYYEVAGNWETKAIVVGWGLDRYLAGATMMKTLQRAEQYISTNEVCSTIYAPSKIYGHNICAGIKDTGGVGICVGDSGSPLFLEGGTLVGLASWTWLPCAEPPYPGVFTKISYYIDWIKQTTGLSV